MPFASGVFTPASPQYPAVAGTLIKAADFNAIIADIASGLSNCLLRDGTGLPTTNIPMGGFRFTGVSDGAARDQFATIGQLQDAELNWIDASGVTGTANAVALAVAPGPSAYEAGQQFFYVVEIENTSEDVTHNVNAIGVANTKKFIGAAKVKVAIGDLQIGMIANIMHDGTDFVLLNPRGYSQGADIASAATLDLDAATGDLVDVTGTTGVTAITLRKGQQRVARFTGSLKITNGASLVLLDGADWQTAAGDYAIFRGYAAGVVRMVGYFRKSNAWTDVASAATVNLDLVPSDNVNVTGTTQIDNLTIAAGRRKLLKFNGSLKVTRGNGTTIDIPGGGSYGGIQVADGDVLEVIGQASGAPARVVSWTKFDGTGVNEYIATGNINTGGDTDITLPSGIIADLTEWELRVEGIQAATDFCPFLRVGNSGIDTGANYNHSSYNWTAQATVATSVSTAQTGIPLGNPATLVDQSNVTANPLDLQVKFTSPNRSDHKNLDIHCSYFRNSGNAPDGAHNKARWLSTSVMNTLRITLRTVTGAQPAGSVVNASGGTYTLRGKR